MYSTIWVLWTKRGFIWVDTWTVTTLEYGLPKTYIYCIKKHLQWPKLWCLVRRVLKRNLRDLCSLKTHLLRKIVQIFWPNSLLCWKRIKNIAGFNRAQRPPVVRKQKQLSCRNSVIVLSAVDFGYHDPQTLCHLTSLCGDFLNKESTAIIQDTWKTLKITQKRLLPALTNKLFEKVQEIEKVNACLKKKLADIFSICRNYRSLNITLVFFYFHFSVQTSIYVNIANYLHFYYVFFPKILHIEYLKTHNFN